MNSIKASPVAPRSLRALDEWPRGDRPTGKWRRAIAGYALGWPWFDGFGAWALNRLFLPASHLWAAAQLADGSPERFLQTLGIPHHRFDRRRLQRALGHFERARVRAGAAESEWQRVFFGPDDSSLVHRIAVEDERLAASHAYNAARRYFAFMLWRGVPPLALQTETPADIAGIYGDAPATPYFTAASEPMPAVEVSRTVPGSIGTDYWLRFKSPSARLGDTVFARVHEPAEIDDPPTLILGHGICVEFDHWRGLIDEAESLRAAGFRVIRPEAPWHGRRTPRGCFGGERIVTVFPSGLIDAFEGAIAEWAVIADWSRRTSRGALAFGGTSLGAQMAQLAADRAASAPERLRPDGLFLVTHCGRMADATLHGELGRVFGCVHNVAAKGWTANALEARLGLLDPRGTPLVAPERIVTVLGNRDRVTPFASALPLLDSWGVPAENRFVWNRAHFSVPMTLIRDSRPVDRFREVMKNVRR